MTTFVSVTILEERCVYLEGICDFCKKESKIEKLCANPGGAHEAYYYSACSECMKSAIKNHEDIRKSVLRKHGIYRIGCEHYKGVRAVWKIRMIDGLPVVHFSLDGKMDNVLVEIEDEYTGTIEVVRYDTLHCKWISN